jgi:hypothetical protein
LDSPILSPGTYAYLRNGVKGFKICDIPMLFTREQGLQAGLKKLFEAAEKAIASGNVLLVLTDRDASESQIPIPSLLAASGLHHHLIRKGKRGECSIISTAMSPERFITLPPYRLRREGCLSERRL